MDFKNLSQDVVEKVCLAMVIWREARGETIEGKEAVASSIIDRVNKPAWWGKDVMSVIFKKWQYSSMTDPKDRQLTTWPQKDSVDWIECLRVADDAIDGRLISPVPGADSYHDTSIAPPKWATKEMFLRQIGRLKFYNTDGRGQVS